MEEDVVADPAAAAPAGDIALGLLPEDLTPWGMFVSADIVVKAVILGLIFASVVTWTIWAFKTLELSSVKRRLQADLARVEAAAGSAALRSDPALSGTYAADFLVAAETELQRSRDAHDKAGIKERVASRFERLEVAASRALGAGTGVLATISATAPFVGLFGTVWGIMNSFIGITREQTTSLAVVAPGIAEALLATAIGLVAAIPAAVIYNHFSRRTAGCRALLGDLSASVLRLVSRELDADRVRASRAAAE